MGFLQKALKTPLPPILKPGEWAKQAIIMVSKIKNIKKKLKIKVHPFTKHKVRDLKEIMPTNHSPVPRPKMVDSIVRINNGQKST